MSRYSILTPALVIWFLLAGAPPLGAAAAGGLFDKQDDYQTLDHKGETIRSLRIPVNITLRNWRDRPFGLRLRLTGTFAVNDLYDILDGDFGTARVSSFVPGLEFVFPVGRNSLLRPYVDAGIGFESETDRTVFLAAAGLRTEFVLTGNHFFYGLEPGFRVHNTVNVDPQGDYFFSPFMTLSARRVLGFTIDGNQPDAGVFFEAGYDFYALELASVRSTRDAVNTQWEVGLGFGFSQSKPGVGPFRFPRIRVGYRFGDLEGWRIRLGGDWLNSVVGLNEVSKGDP